MKKGRVELGANEEEGESESKVTNQVLHPKIDVRYLENIFSDFRSVFPHKGVFVTKVIKANIIAVIKTKNLRPDLSVTSHSFRLF